MKKSVKENLGVTAIGLLGVSLCATLAAGLNVGGWLILPCTVSAIADGYVIRCIIKNITE